MTAKNHVPSAEEAERKRRERAALRAAGLADIRLVGTRLELTALQHRATTEGWGALFAPATRRKLAVTEPSKSLVGVISGANAQPKDASRGVRAVAKRPRGQPDASVSQGKNGTQTYLFPS